MTIHSMPNFIRLDAFNLWEGAVITESDTLWNTDDLQVVLKVWRNSDTEEVILIYRDLFWNHKASNVSGTGTPPRRSVLVVSYNDSFRVFGNVVNPHEVDDENIGQPVTSTPPPEIVEYDDPMDLINPDSLPDNLK